MCSIAKSGTLQAMAFCLVVWLGIVKTGTSGDTNTLAPGYGPLAFSAPRPGSYTLPRLGAASNGEVLDSEGWKISLHNLMGDKIVLLGFIYTTCTDVNGCPLATAVFHQIKSLLGKHPEVARQLRLLTLSFNPSHDTPAVMKKYGGGLTRGEFDWRFLTTASDGELNPILENYHQAVIKEYDGRGRFTGTFSHVLRVLLIDRDKQIRKIYSVSFLHAELLINDIKTLLSPPDDSGGSSERAPETHEVRPLYKPGDSKTHYDTSEYRTQSIALTDRLGKRANLMQFVESPPLGLPALVLAPQNPITSKKVDLGRKLFFDRRLSANNTFSCAMCHIPEQGFTNNEMSTPIGVEGRSVRRNAPTLYNVGYARVLFHDGRESTLEQQVWGPMLAGNEMANPSIGFVIDKLKSAEDYPELFKAAYGTGPDMINVGNAIASYQRTLNSANSRFDRWVYAGIEQAVNESAKRGFGLFTGKARCAACHQIGKDNSLFNDNQFHDTGIGFRRILEKGSEKLRLQVAPGVFLNVDGAAIRSVAAPEPNDLGRYEITGLPQDRWKYKTPSLRNIALTAPYMHDGSLLSLKSVIEFYSQGGLAHENLDPLIKPLSLTDNEINDLVAFLESLTGDNIETLVSDAFAAAVGVAE
ncbi:MAG: cytochrome c peroxidase [Methylococcales bacterium]